MKRLLLICSVVILFMGCEKAKEAIDYKMTATVDGSEWKTRVAVGTLQDGNFLIVGTNEDKTIIEITINGSSEGTYEQIAIPPACVGIYKLSASSSYDDVYESVQATVTLTEVNTSKKRISGTFSFPTMAKGISLETIEISDGVFTDVPYTEK